ncbi:hypothetical protein HAPAU_25900 [Halalkalicoccus paucihalophilus]|uniref:Uncharacterized protein n=1 Tax=Halalkalicoccus paucihalophilus TaxID=1008153 RepID=A0A151AEE3_9EURY|nr:hypothetical protein [Halalkalicoccus paucihalophilus]KYH25912.1 hypothetical protein HAPAU_25900 [Halalkalicoccus paucihalophilus]
MMWQDFVFMAGSSLSIVFLAPTLRDTAARVPIATSAPSMIIGGVYAVTFATLGMTFSAAGALATCVMWTLISFFRAPKSPYNRSHPAGSAGDRFDLFCADARNWVERKRHRDSVRLDSYAPADASSFASRAD